MVHQFQDMAKLEKAQKQVQLDKDARIKAIKDKVFEEEEKKELKIKS
jgi:hypothetical protein